MSSRRCSQRYDHRGRLSSGWCGCGTGKLKLLLLMKNAAREPSEPYLFAATIRPQDGLLLKQLLVRLADLFDLLAAVLPRLDGVEQNQEHGALLDDYAAGAAELSKAP